MSNIIILGAGQVGTSVAKNLSTERHNITVIDRDANKLKELASKYDLRTVTGNAGHPSVLRAAGITDCDLLIAVTEVDEINMMACKIAASLFNVPKRIARVRSSEYLDDPRLSGEDVFGISHAISPEVLLAQYVENLVVYPEALQVLEFANRQVCLVAVRAKAGGLLVGDRIGNLHKHLKVTEARIVAIFRESSSVQPMADTIIQDGDEVFFLSRTDDMRRVMEELRKADRPVRRIMIAGGSEFSYRLAKDLESSHSVKLIEVNEKRAHQLVALLDHTVVLHGSENDSELLINEDVAHVDLFVAATGDDERNIIASLLAKKMGAHRVLSLIHQSVYVGVLEDSRIDVVVGLADVTIGSILAHIRRADVARVHSLRRGAAEALEIVIHGDKSTSQCVGRRVDAIQWPTGALLGAVVRGQEVLMAHHDLVLETEDHLILFVNDINTVRKIEKLLQVSASFFG
jgi:trk system potassium uptake protein TrkA